MFGNPSTPILGCSARMCLRSKYISGKLMIEPYFRIRMGARERARSPVFGRVLSREPIIPQRISFEQRPRHLDGNPSGASQARLYGGEVRPSGIGPGVGAGTGAAGSSPRRSSKNRYVGVSSNLAANNVAGSHNSVAVHGSFQKLKELIWTERAKELTQQRRAEELAARAAVLKEIANGQKYDFFSFFKPY